MVSLQIEEFRLIILEVQDEVIDVALGLVVVPLGNGANELPQPVLRRPASSENTR